ncbi:MAG: hypothetical protein WCB53_04340 [Terriglobales bacterium]
MHPRSSTSVQKIVFAWFLCVVVASGIASADSIQLRDGRHLQGKYIGGSSATIGFMTAHSVEYFQTSEVLALVFDNTPESNSTPAPNALQSNPMNGNSSRAASSGRVKQTSAQSRRKRKPQLHAGPKRADIVSSYVID